MAEPTPIERAEALIRANPREQAAYELGRDLGFVDGYAQGWQDSPEGDPEAYDDSASKAAAYLLLAEVESGTILPRARDIAARVAELDRLDAAHPGVWSQEDVRVERERLLGEIGRALGGGR